MKRLVLFVLCSILLLTFSSVTVASPPVEKVFELTGSTTIPGVMTFHGNIIRIRGLEAAGDVTGDFVGTFDYTENVTINLNTVSSTSQGFMTMTITEGCRDGAGTIDIRFQGRSEPGDFGWIIDEQPFTILKGTGGCEGIHGSGTRSATVVPDYPFVVTYTAKVHWDPE